MTIQDKIIQGVDLTEKELYDCSMGLVGTWIEDREGEKHRWTQSMTTIFKIDEQYYALEWEQGLTEYQENEFWEQPYKVKKVEEVITTTVTRYVTMEEQND